MHRLFQYGAHCLSGRERLAARAGRSGGDYRAERRSLLQGSLLQNTDTIPTQYKKQRCPFRFLHRRMVVCCICSGNFCNQGKFEKTKEMHRLFQYGARCLSVRERLAARAERSGGDYRAERRSLARFALAEH